MLVRNSSYPVWSLAVVAAVGCLFFMFLTNSPTNPAIMGRALPHNRTLLAGYIKAQRTGIFSNRTFDRHAVFWLSASIRDNRLYKELWHDTKQCERDCGVIAHEWWFVWLRVWRQYDVWMGWGNTSGEFVFVCVSVVVIIVWVKLGGGIFFKRKGRNWQEGNTHKTN